MAGRILTYLLSVLFPLSPMLCGQCSGSVCCSLNQLACCPELTNEVSQLAKCCELKCCEANCSLAEEASSLDLVPSCVKDRLVLHSSRCPLPIPCRHEFCRSAICGQSAVALRRMDWSLNDTLRKVVLDHPIWFGADLLYQPVQSRLGWFPVDSDWNVNLGPHGRAARIYFCSWQI